MWKLVAKSMLILSFTKLHKKGRPIFFLATQREKFRSPQSGCLSKAAYENSCRQALKIVRPGGVLITNFLTSIESELGFSLGRFLSVYNSPISAKNVISGQYTAVLSSFCQSQRQSKHWCWSRAQSSTFGNGVYAFRTHFPVFGMYSTQTVCNCSSS